MFVNKMPAKSMLAGVLVLCALSVVSLRFAWATPGQGVVTTILTGPVQLDEIELRSISLDHQVRVKTKGYSDVYIVHNRVAPGGQTGWHSHPGISFITVKSGQATEYHGDDPLTPHVYGAGNGLVEEAGGVHNIRNEGDVDLELVAFQILPYGATRRIDEPQP